MEAIHGLPLPRSCRQRHLVTNLHFGMNVHRLRHAPLSLRLFVCKPFNHVLSLAGMRCDYRSSTRASADLTPVKMQHVGGTGHACMPNKQLWQFNPFKMS